MSSNSNGIPAARRLGGNRHEDIIMAIFAMAILAVLLIIVGTIMMAMSQKAGAMAAQVRKGAIHAVLCQNLLSGNEDAIRKPKALGPSEVKREV